jgi:hypothetical protein
MDGVDRAFLFVAMASGLVAIVALYMFSFY